MTNRLLRVFLLSLAAVAVCATPAWAADIEWTAATGNVNVGSNWNTLTVPTTGDMAYIRNAGTATIGEGNVFGGALLGLMVGYTDGVTSYGNVTQAGGTVTTGSGRFQVGVGDGSGPITTDLSTYTISGGLVDAAGYYSRIGYNSGYGKLAMSGTSQYHTNSHLYVGDTGGSGILEMSDTAIVTVGARLSLGNGSKLVDETRYYSTGALTMSGSSKIVADVAGTNSPVIGYNGGDATVTMTDSSLLDMSLATGVAYIGHGQESDVSVTLGTAAVGGDHTASMKFGGDLRIGSGPTNGNDLLGNVNSTVALYDHTSITAVGKFSVGVWNFCYGTLNLHDNASVTSGADFVIGDANDGSGTYTFGDGGNGTMTVSDNSTVNVGSSLLVGAFNTGHGTMTVGNMTGSATGTANVNVGSSTTVGSQGEGTLNLGQGGVLTTSRITVGLTGTYGNGVGTVKFNGGTVVAKASNNNFIAGGGGTATTLVQSGGLTIDSNGYDLVVKTDLLEDSGSTGGGLTKNGAGQLVLASDMNTITGATTVNAGTLVANTRDLEGTPFGATTVKAGACLTSAKWDTVTDLIKTEGETDLSTSSLTFDDGAKIGVILLDNGGGDLTGVSSITTGALAASATSALVEVVLPTTAPAGTGSYAIVNYASNSGVTFMPKVDGAGTKGVTITDDTMGTVSITLGDMNQWIPGGANPNYSVGGNWTDSVAPNGTAQRALFTGTGETVTLDMNATLSSLNFEGDGGCNIIASGAEKFTMDSSIAMNAHIQNVSGSNTVAAPIVLNKDTLVTVAQAVDTLTLSGAVTGAGR
ncbi:MAG: hypothetical protein GX621_07205, partial [Pirellulaceae bacterium]|nr:hypothetical protein [Pirellulaceae bacterium]